MKAWTPVWNGLVDSSVWKEPDHVFRVFMAMITLKDFDHIIRMDAYQLANRIHMEAPIVLDALRILQEPDKARPGQAFEGRRVKQVTEGFLILNAEKYREMVAIEQKRAANRRAQAKWRANQKANQSRIPLMPSTVARAEEREGREAADAAAERYDQELAEAKAEQKKSANPCK